MTLRQQNKIFNYCNVNNISCSLTGNIFIVYKDFIMNEKIEIEFINCKDCIKKIDDYVKTW